MPATFDWDNAEEIGIRLAEKLPDVDPLTVRFTDLHKWVIGLDGFTGDASSFQRRQARSHPNGVARGISTKIRANAAKSPRFPGILPRPSASKETESPKNRPYACRN